MSVPRDAHVNTFYGFMDRFLISRGHKLAYEQMGGRVSGKTSRAGSSEK